MSRLVRSATLTNYVPVAVGVGLDAYRLVAECGLPVDSLINPDVRVPVHAVNQLLEESARRSGKLDFGLRLAEHRSLSNLGALALLVREQPTVRKALEAMVNYMHVHNEALTLRMIERRGIVTLTLDIDVGRLITVRQGAELGIGFLHRSLTQLLGRLWRPIAISFAHDPPPRKDAHERFFGVPVEFNQERNAIHCSVEDMSAAVPASDAAMARHVQIYLDTIAARPKSTMRTNARESILAMLPTGLCTAERVAKRLGIDRRTLHRRLIREDESFGSVVEKIRDELVTRHLANRDQKLSEIADLLGFSSLSAFSRWFRHRYGESATTWKRRNTGTQPWTDASTGSRHRSDASK